MVTTMSCMFVVRDMPEVERLLGVGGRGWFELTASGLPRQCKGTPNAVL